MIEEFLKIFNKIHIFDLVFIIILIYFVIQCFIKGFSLSLISFMKWVFSTIITIILVPKTLSIYSRNKKINDLDELSNGYVYSENDGEVVGAHVGAHFYTIGQRKGISVGGTKDPLYVIALDTKKNIIYVGEGDNHPGLMRKVLCVKKSQFHNIDDGSDITKFHGLKARIRYRQALLSLIHI